MSAEVWAVQMRPKMSDSINQLGYGTNLSMPVMEDTELAVEISKRRYLVKDQDEMISLCM
jgi:hypothetical protein